MNCLVAIPETPNGGVLEKDILIEVDSLAAKSGRGTSRSLMLRTERPEMFGAVQIGHLYSRFVLPETGSDRASPSHYCGGVVFLYNIVPHFGTTEL